MGAEALNLEAIAKAIKQHNGSCDFPVHTIRMAPFEVERLGWDDFQGIPIREDPDMQTGRFRLECDRPVPGGDPLEIEEPVTVQQTTPVEMPERELEKV
jgi:hypothetical protein